MKKGSGDDPFADLEEEDDEADDSGGEPHGSDVEVDGSPDSSEESSSSTTERYTDSGGSGAADSTAHGDAETADSTGDVDAEPTDSTVGTSETADSTSEAPQKDAVTDESGDDGMSKAEADGIPWVLRRSRVKEDRENVHQFFLREEYSTREDEILESVADELDMRQKDLQKLDVREAMVAAADPEDIAAVLREWGYEYLK